MTIAITCNGKALTFASAAIERSLETAVGRLTFATWADLRGLVDGEIEVTEDGDLRFTGLLEQIQGSAVAGYQCTARSKAVQLERFDALGNESFFRSTLRDVAASLALKAGATVGSAPTRAVPSFRLKRGESYQAALQRLAAHHAVIVTDDASGAVRLFAFETQLSASATWRDRASTVTAPIALDLDYTEWRREWVCRGARTIVGNDASSGDVGAIALTAITGLTRPSRRVIGNRAASGKGNARTLLDWEAKRALAKVARITVQHASWPGEPGDVVRVVSDDIGVDDLLTISAIQADLDEQRYVATCVFPDVYRADRLLEQARSTRPSAWARGGDLAVGTRINGPERLSPEQLRAIQEGA